MKAAVFREVNVPMEIEEVTVSKPGPREVLIRTQAAGICHSDMHFFNGCLGLCNHVRGETLAFQCRQSFGHINNLLLI